MKYDQICVHLLELDFQLLTNPFHQRPLGFGGKEGTETHHVMALGS